MDDNNLFRHGTGTDLVTTFDIKMEPLIVNHEILHQSLPLRCKYFYVVVQSKANSKNSK